MSEKSLTEIMSGVPTTESVNFFDNDRNAGIEIAWSRKGHGFGAITFGYDKQKKCWFSNTECTSDKTITTIIRRAAPLIAEKLLRIEAGENVNEVYDELDT
jgi:hypothetical protein